MRASIIRRVFIYVVLAGLLAANAGCSGSGKKENIPAGDKTELRILFSSDLLGKIRSCGCTIEDVGGLGRRVTYADEVRNSSKNLLIVDAGDAFSLDLSYLKSEAELTFESFNIMGLDVFTPGELEFIFGLEFLQALAENSDFDIVSANIVSTETGEPLFGKTYVIKELEGGLKVGVTGVLDESVRFPGYIDQSMFSVEPAEKSLRSVLPAMRREADFLILLSHMGIERTEDMLSRIKDFDIAVVGHGKPLLKDRHSIGKTLMLATGGLGQYIGSLTLELDGSGNYTEGLLSQVQMSSKKYEIDPRVKELFRIYGLPLSDKEFKKEGKSLKK